MAVLGSLLLGPAGAIGLGVLGGMLGTIVGGGVADRRNLPALCEARDRAVAELGGFAFWFRNGPLERLERLLIGHRHRTVDWARRARRSDFPPELTSALEAVARTSCERASGLRSWLGEQLAGGDPGKAHAGLVSLEETAMVLDPETHERAAGVRRALEHYRKVAEATT